MAAGGDPTRYQKLSLTPYFVEQDQETFRNLASVRPAKMKEYGDSNLQNLITFNCCRKKINLTPLSLDVELKR